MSAQDPRELILEALRKYPEGLTLISLAKITGLHRHTCTKYIHELLGAGAIYQRSVGVAKLCYLKENIENKDDEKKLLEVIDRRKIGKKSQIKLIALVVLVTFLMSETAIFAYENASLLNETNITGLFEINTSPMTESSFNDSNLSQILNISTEKTVDLNTSQILIPDTSTQENALQENRSVENFTETVETNENSSELNETNQSADETVIIDRNETSIEPEKNALNLEINLEKPQKITRGEILTLKTTVLNLDSSTARNVILKWKLPNGFEITSGSDTESCGNLEPSASCTSQIDVKTGLSTVLGTDEIRVVVSYEA